MHDVTASISLTWSSPGRIPDTPSGIHLSWAKAIDRLQNSEIKGQRHLKDKTRQQYEQSQRKSEFWQRMDQFKKDRKPA
jgi:hypothetical protein